MIFFTFFERVIHFLIDILFPPRDTAKIVIGTGFEVLSKLCAPKQFNAISYLLPYKSKTVQAFILEAKFHENKKAHMYLGQLLAEYLLDTYSNMKQCGIDAANLSSITLIPVPLGKKRLKERGYNQVAEITKSAVLFLKESAYSDTLVQEIPIVLKGNLLCRVKETAPQTTLARKDRLLNMQNVFLAQERPDLDTLYIVIDDVVTTGSSLLSAREALKAAGAEHIQILALAH